MFSEIMLFVAYFWFLLSTALTGNLGFSTTTLVSGLGTSVCISLVLGLAGLVFGMHILQTLLLSSYAGTIHALSWYVGVVMLSAMFLYLAMAEFTLIGAHCNMAAFTTAVYTIPTLHAAHVVVGVLML